MTLKILIFISLCLSTKNYSQIRFTPAAIIDSITNNRNIKIVDEIIDVEILDLISNPEKFDEKIVRIKGYLNLEFEGTALYATNRDYKKRYYSRSIFLNTRSVPRIYNKKRYAEVVGRFTSKHKGHHGMFGGLLMDVYKIDY